MGLGKTDTMRRTAPSRAVDETILAAPAEPAPGNDASAPASHPAAAAFHHRAAHRESRMRSTPISCWSWTRTTPPSAGAETEIVPASTYPSDLPVDSVWEDIYDALPARRQHRIVRRAQRKSDLVAAHRAQTESLKDRLHWQVSMLRLSDTDRAIAAALVDAVDDDGYLTLDPRRHPAGSRSRRTREVTLERDRGRCSGTGSESRSARAWRRAGWMNASRCSLRQLPADTEWRDAALVLVTRHLHGARFEAATPSS